MCTLSLQGGGQRTQCFQNTGINVTSQTLSSRILPNTLRNPDSVTTALFGEIIQMMEKLRLREIKWLTWSLMDIYYRKDSPFASLAPIACSQNLDFSAQASFHFPPKIPLFYKEDHRGSAHPQSHMIVCPISRLVFLVIQIKNIICYHFWCSIFILLPYFHLVSFSSCLKDLLNIVSSVVSLQRAISVFECLKKTLFHLWFWKIFFQGVET